MKTARKWGFTLIELLVVIAIIGILAGLVSVALPRALERAKIADVEADFNAIRTALTQYYTENESYPPGYGFRTWPPDEPGNYTQTYMAYIGLFGAQDFHDRFSANYDANRNDTIDLLEYVPYNMGTDTFEPIGTLPIYAGGLGVVGRMKDEQRPYIYAPYFSKQMDNVKRTIVAAGGQVWDGNAWNTDFDTTLGYPPPRYDGFVLISVGPEENSHGVASPPDMTTFIGSTPDYIYNILALRAAYLGSRDVNENGILDFDFRARTRQGEANPNGYADPAYRLLPDGTAAGGPLLYHQAP